MTDILIRGLPEATVAEIDRLAGELGISRNEYLRRRLEEDIHPARKVTVDDLSCFGRLARDLYNPEVMRRAWS